MKQGMTTTQNHILVHDTIILINTVEQINNKTNQRLKQAPKTHV